MDGYRIQTNCPQCGKTTPYILAETTFIENHCDHCHASFSLSSEKLSGFVYVLVNDQIPDLIKIGFTDRDPFTRCRELSKSTGVPADFEVFCYYAIDAAPAFEANIHEYLKLYRLRGKEFFRLPPDQAVTLITREFGIKPDYISHELSKIYNNYDESGCLTPSSSPENSLGAEHSETGREQPSIEAFIEALKRKPHRSPLPEGYEAKLRCRHCNKMNLIRSYDVRSLKPKCGSCGEFLGKK